ncbi:MAG TPA: hypothetical protein PLV83_00710 [Bacilli bacterium]|nr:hypothetical protein [Bacilli bacterium]
MNNLNAPRFRPPIKTTLDNDFFNYLYEKYPEFKYKYNKKQIKEIILKFNELLGEELISNRAGVELPVLGKKMIMMSYLAKENSTLDYEAYNKSNGQIKKSMLNLHTNGYKLKIVFKQYTKKARIKELHFYGADPERSLSRKCAAAFKLNYNFYSTLSPLEEKEQKEEENYTKTNTKDFNEFEL